MTQPAGWRGNDQPFSTVSENWWSPELQGEALSKNIDPRFGERTQKLINLNRVEPHPNRSNRRPALRSWIRRAISH
jgi:hypothetical protein